MSCTVQLKREGNASSSLSSPQQGISRTTDQATCDGPLPEVSEGYVEGQGQAELTVAMNQSEK